MYARFSRFCSAAFAQDSIVCVCVLSKGQHGQMKSRDGKSQRREEKKEDQKRESLRRKKIQVREKVGKSRHTVFFQWFVAPEAH